MNFKGISIGIFILSFLFICVCLKGGDDALIGYWPLDSGKGKVAFDKSRNHDNGKLFGPKWLSFGKNSVLNFDPGQYVSIPHKECLNVKKAFTIALWVNLNNIHGEMAFFSKGRRGDFSGYDFYQINGKLALSMATTEKPGVGIAKAGYRLFSKPVLKAKEWAFIAVSYDSVTRKAIFYHNDKKIGEASAAGEVIYAPKGFFENWDYEALPVALGSMAICPGHYMLLDGVLRDVKIFNRALDANEIQKERTGSIAVRNIVFERESERLEKTFTSLLKVSIKDKKSGKPINAKVCVKDKKRSYAPVDMPVYTDKKGVRFFYTKGGFDLKVPVSELEVSVEKGLEYKPFKTKVNTSNGASQELSVGLEREIDMPQKGWFCGEHHIHALGHGKWPHDRFFGNTQKTAEKGFLNACDICMGAGLNFVNFVTSSPWEIGPRYSMILKRKDFIGYSGWEWTPPTGGHLCLVNCPRFSRKGREKGMFSHMDLLDVMKQNNAIGVFTHPYSGKVGNVSANCVARELPLGIALGKAKIWDVMSWGNREKALEDWARFLNCGFKVAASAGSDAYLNQGPPSLMRMYCKLKKLSWPGIVQSYKNGSTFITDGPVVIFRVNGNDIGETIMLSGRKAENISIELEAFSLGGLERLEIIKNGKVIKNLDVSGRKFKDEISLEIEETCWLALRCRGRKNEFVGAFAQTSPIYVQFGSEPMRASDKDIDYFVNWLETYKKVLPDFAKKYKGNLSNAKELYKKIDKAIEIYKSLKKNPRYWQHK